MRAIILSALSAKKGFCVLPKTIRVLKKKHVQFLPPIFTTILFDVNRELYLSGKWGNFADRNITRYVCMWFHPTPCDVWIFLRCTIVALDVIMAYLHCTSKIWNRQRQDALPSSYWTSHYSPLNASTPRQCVHNNFCLYFKSTHNWENYLFLFTGWLT